MLLENGFEHAATLRTDRSVRIGRTTHVQRIGAYVGRGVTVDQHVAATPGRGLSQYEQRVTTRATRLALLSQDRQVQLQLGWSYRCTPRAALVRSRCARNTNNEREESEGPRMSTKPRTAPSRRDFLKGMGAAAQVLGLVR